MQNLSTFDDAQQLTGIDDIVEKVERRISDLSVAYNHIHTNTMEDYYQEVVGEILYDLTVFPVDRDMADMDILDNQENVIKGLHSIASIISLFFNKEQSTVERDIIDKMNAYPIEDIRQSRTLANQNRLN